ncbi:ABC transporter ATP-binding protein [Lactobacillus sp. PV037]|uniref:ATP-binding cassette domain-containing protein n=1 Tax=Lactobacillus sp. PV037 TaxID=2594496 RepID=UPI00223F8FA9|nr:ABC transporter ATP-binding protein [Lactobacillus sp. PV037]
MMKNKEMLQIENLTYHKNLKTILSKIDLNITSGKIVALLGENGAGKTTLMRLIAGLANNYKGQIQVECETKSENRKALVSMSDSLSGLGNGTSIKWIKEFYERLFSDFDQEQFEELKKFMKLNDEMKLGQLSKGMQEKLSIALTLSRHAKLYLLDEPFSGIDPMTRKKIINSILLWKDEDSTLIISDHFVNEIRNLLDEVVIIKDHQIAAQISAEDIRQQGKTIEEYYTSFYEDEE